MVIDESQNLSPLELKTIVTAWGKLKIVLTGDVEQIDHLGFIFQWSSLCGRLG